jgi:multidrug resistance protein MdtO
MVLWLWVIVMVPASVTVTINLAFGQDPRALTRRTASRLLRSLADALRTDASSELRDQSIRALELTAMREHAGIFDRDLQRLSAVDSGLIDTLAEVLAIARILPPQASRPAKASLRALTEHCLAAFERREGGERAALDLSEETCSASRPVVVAMFAALQRLADGIAQRNAPGSSRPTSEHPHPVFAPDAFTSPSHLRFALKATVGAMLAYAIYSGLDWPGINTSMTTVFFVALGSLGESVHKFTLRIGGALVGGTLAALCLVYVLPWMTDVGQLCLLIAAVCAICAWIATSDERLSYAGLQIAFAFLLGTLQGYGQSTSFTFFKDRMCGILLGNVVVFIVFSLLWPVSVVGRARTSMAASLHAVGGLLKRDAPRPGTRIAILKGVSEGRRLLALAAFELRTLPAEAAARLLLRGESLDRLAAAAFVVVEQDIGGTPDAFRAEDRLTAGWFDAASDRLLSRDGGPVHDLTPPEARAYAGSNTREQIAGEARTLLRHEIEVASAN